MQRRGKRINFSMSEKDLGGEQEVDGGPARRTAGEKVRERRKGGGVKVGEKLED